jgi:hypothetical protein
MPVRTMGGWSRVDMALWFCSLTGPMAMPEVLLKALSRVPPTECIELAVDPRRGL